MHKKKGFTLIELLAVIVILAVLALIATPIVLNIISDAKNEAVLRSAENYIKSVEYSIAKGVMNNIKISDGTYPILENGNVCLGVKNGETCTGEILGVEVNGETPLGSVTFASRRIKKANFYYGELSIVKKTNGDLIVSDNVCKIAEDSTIYGTEIGAKYICNLGETNETYNLTFYVLQASTETTSTYLIMDRNYDYETVSWCDQNGDYPYTNYLCNGDGLQPKIDEIRDSWTKLESDQITLPTAQQIANVDNIQISLTNLTVGGVTFEVFDRDTNSIVLPIELSSTWLYNNLGDSFPAGYWTLTKCSSSTTSYHKGALNVNKNANIANGNVKNSLGVRPVIILDI